MGIYNLFISVNFFVWVCVGAVIIAIIAYLVNSKTFNKPTSVVISNPPIKNLAYIILSALFIAIDAFLVIFYYMFQTTTNIGWPGILLFLAALFSPLVGSIAIIAVLIGITFYFIIKKWGQNNAPIILVAILAINIIFYLVAHYGMGIF